MNHRAPVSLLTVFAVCLLAAAAVRFAGEAAHFIDDPFISLRDAAALVTRGELAFNPGERVEGYSNFRYVLVHAVLFVARGALPPAFSAIDGALVLGVIASIAQLVLMGRLVTSSQQGQAAWFYALVLTAASWPFAFWAVAGLETPIEGLFYLGIVCASTRLRAEHSAAGELPERCFSDSRSVVAVGEAGLIPYVARNVRFLDLFGSVDRDMAKQPGGMHQRVHVDHFLERAPAAVVFAHLGRKPPYGPYQYGPELLASPLFHASYRRVSLNGKLDAAGWALYVRESESIITRGLRWSAHDPLAVAARRQGATAAVQKNEGVAK